jgi:hypothetical protein
VIASVSLGTTGTRASSAAIPRITAYDHGVESRSISACVTTEGDAGLRRRAGRSFLCWRRGLRGPMKGGQTHGGGYLQGNGCRYSPRARSSRAEPEGGLTPALLIDDLLDPSRELSDSPSRGDGWVRALTPSGARLGERWDSQSSSSRRPGACACSIESGSGRRSWLREGRRESGRSERIRLARAGR